MGPSVLGEPRALVEEERIPFPGEGVFTTGSTGGFGEGVRQGLRPLEEPSRFLAGREARPSLPDPVVRPGGVTGRDFASFGDRGVDAARTGVGVWPHT
mgnify:FL=1